MKGLKPHKFAELAPMMTGMERAALLEDIRVNGQQEPIVLYQGQILDGRNRDDILKELKRKPIFVTFKGDDAAALALVKSKLMHRNLTDSQRAAVAVNYLPVFEQAAKMRMQAGGSAQVREGQTGKAAANVAAQFGVSPRYVEFAKSIKAGDPKLFQSVLEGTETITRAARLMRRNQRRATVKRMGGAIIPTPQDFKFHTGDSVKWLNAQERRSVRLCFMDPPYNLGFTYDGDPTGDKLPRAKYLTLIKRNLDQAHDVLTPDGSLFLMICEEWVHHFGLLLEETGFTIRRLIVWHESFGQAGTKNFGRTCRFIWYAVKDPARFVFDETALLTQSKRATVYADKRAMPGGKVLDALWDFSRVAGTFAERIPDPNIPTQLPVELLKRIVAGFSDPGDWVLDPMCGTGTTARACLSLGRKCISIDRSKKYIAIAQRELALANGKAKE